MKHSIILGLLAVVMMTGIVVAPAAHAEESTTTAATTTVSTTTAPAATTTVAAGSSRIADLLAQLAKLTALFNDLKAKLMGVTTELHELKGDLKEGMTDADIKAIQEALASDPTIYPSGLKTGFFGPMTKEAIKKFQAKNGLEVTGEINAETKAALDTVLEHRRSEGRFPVGLMLASSTKQKFEDRLRVRCDAVTASSTAATPCARIKEKYKFEVDDKGRIKMEREIQKGDDKSKVKDEDTEDTEDDDSDDTEDESEDESGDDN